MSIFLWVAQKFLCFLLLGLAALTVRLIYLLHIWNKKQVRSIPVEVLSVNWQTEYQRHRYGGGRDPVQECYAVVRHIKPRYKKRKRSMSAYGNRAYDPNQEGEFWVKVYSQRRFLPFEYGGENLVTNRTLHPGDKTVLYINSHCNHTLTHYTAKSLTRHWLKLSAAWTGLWLAFVLLLTAWVLITRP